MKVLFADRSVEEYEDKSLAAGAEGEVFRSRDGKSVIKLYYPDPARDAARIERIDRLIHEFNPTKGDPYWRMFFTWPEKRIVQPAIGFRMPFVGGLKTLDHYFFGKAYYRLRPEERGWFIGRIAVAIKLVSAADRLTRMGLCYPDFSDKNIMVEPFSGRMVLIDCDSLTVPGKLPPTVEGTTTYRAPEIVSRVQPTPTVRSDRHALAVILYRWFLSWHPLLGDRQFDPNDPDHDDQLRYGEKALYIEHPTDPSNRASKQRLKAAHLGPELERLFQAAFVDGLRSPDMRPLPNQWQQALYHSYDQVIPCASPYCEWRFFVARPTPRLTCPKCQTPLENPETLPFMYLLPQGMNPYAPLPVNTHYVVGWPKRPLHIWHVRSDATVIYTDPAYVRDIRPYSTFEYEQNTGRWHLRNLGLHDMCYVNPRDPTRSFQSWPINQPIELTPGMIIRFGKEQQYFQAHIKLERVG